MRRGASCLGATRVSTSAAISSPTATHASTSSSWARCWRNTRTHVWMGSERAQAGHQEPGRLRRARRGCRGAWLPVVTTDTRSDEPSSSGVVRPEASCASKVDDGHEAGLDERNYLQSRPGARKPLRGRPRARGTLHPAEHRVEKQRPASVDPLARARAAAILAERHLMMAIKAAELRFEETAELGREFDRRLERRKSGLREAGYLAGRATADV